jgi:hypothetical protein
LIFLLRFIYWFAEIDFFVLFEDWKIDEFRDAEFVSSGKFLLGSGVIADLRLLVLEVC